MKYDGQTQLKTIQLRNQPVNNINDYARNCEASVAGASSSHQCA